MATPRTSTPPRNPDPARSKRKLALTALLIALLAGGILSIRHLRPDPNELMKKRLAERSLGQERAPVWVTEYFDYQCPPCARAAKVLREEIAANPDRYYLQVRYFPLPGHKNAMKAAIYGDCVVRQNKGIFWAFHEKVFEHQDEWANDPYAQIHFARFAEEAGADLRSLEACAADPAVEEAIRGEKKKGEELGVQTTPSFFINGKLVVGVSSLKSELTSSTETPHES